MYDGILKEFMHFYNMHLFRSYGLQMKVYCHTMNSRNLLSSMEAILGQHHANPPFSPRCTHFLVALTSLEKTRGSSVEEVFRHTDCGYKSEKYKLYKEIPQSKPGHNPSSLNVSPQLASYNKIGRAHV